MENKQSCFICNAQLGVSSRNSFNIFKTIIFPIEKRASELIADVLDVEIQENLVHSEVICRKCFKLVNEFADIEARAAEIRTDLIGNYNNTQRILEEGDAALVNDAISLQELHEQAYEEEEEEEERPEEEQEEIEEGDTITIDPARLTQLVSDADGVSLSELFSKNQEGGNRPKLLVVKNGVYETIEIPEMLSEEGIEFTEQNSVVEISEEERIVDYIDERHVCRLCSQQDENQPFSCETKNLSLMVNHLKQKHEIRIYLCDLCGEEFKKRNDFSSHLESHNMDLEDGNHVCEVCKRVFTNFRLYRIHRRLHRAQSKAWTCAICDKKCSSKNLLEEHRNMHFGVRPHNCKICGKTFSSKYTYKSHLKTHENRERNYGCSLCEKTFLSAHNLQQHSKTHSESKDHVCDLCGKGFGSLRSLEVHGIVHTGVKPFMCRHCGKKFARKAELKDHERTHTGERPFQCEHCGAQFSQRSNLQSHKRVTHFNDRRYFCSLCEKGFKRKRLLDYHVKAVHTGERPYQCSTCDAAFVYPEHYKKHIRIHTGVKPYKCEVCEKAFNSRDNRNAHRFVHSDKKPYECLVCGLGFMRKPLLYNHMQQAGHVNDTIVVNQPRLEKDGIALADNDQEIELTIVGDNNQRQKVYLSDISEHVIIEANDKTLLAKFKDGNTFKGEDSEKSLVDEDGNLVDMEGNVIEIQQLENEMTMTAHINEQGQLVNEDGQVISEDGQTLIVDASMQEENSQDVLVKGEDDVQFVHITVPDGQDQPGWLNVIKAEEEDSLN